MSGDGTPGGYDAPTERRGYVPQEHGYVPAGQAGDTTPLSDAAARRRKRGGSEEYHGHPLHHIYRRRIRGVRVRWLGGGFVFGVVLGVLFTLVASALVVTQFPAVVQSFTGEPD